MCDAALREIPQCELPLGWLARAERPLRDVAPGVEHGWLDLARSEGSRESSEAAMYAETATPKRQPATGRHIAAESAEVFRMADGKFVGY